MSSDLRHLAELQAKATKGEWTALDEFVGVRFPMGGQATICECNSGIIVSLDEARDNSHFIAAARNTDFAALAERLERLEKLTKAQSDLLVCYRNDIREADHE